MNNNNACNICMLQPYLTPYRLGLFNELADRLDGRLTLLYFSREEESRKWSFDRNIRFHEYFLKTHVTHSGYENNRIHVSFFSLFWSLFKLRPDVVIGSEGPLAKSLRFLQIFFGFRLLFWTEMHEVVMRDMRPRSWLVKWLDSGVSAYIIPGKLSGECLRNTRKYNGPVYLAPNTIERAQFICTVDDVTDKTSKEEIRFLFSGSLVPRKGIDTLLDAFRRLVDTEGVARYRLDIIGDGPMEKKPIENVFYHGFVAQERCAEFMKQAHVFVLPSLWDCNPLVVTEAVTSGCITVLSDGVGNYPEYADGNGFVFERGNADALYETLLKVLQTDRSELKVMAERSLAIASQVSHENSADSFMRAIMDCTEKP